MNLLVIIQARMSSKRLPGKMLKTIENKILLQYLIDGLMNSQEISDLLVVTSDDISDDALANYCINRQIKYFRGSLDDVAGRFVDALKQNPCDAFVRVCGDSPLLDYRLLDKGINIYKKGDYELVTNVAKRTYPSGQSIEIIKTEVFIDTYSKMNTNDDLEHVTHYFYNNQDQYSICNFRSEVDYSDIKIAVDTMQDFKLIKKVIGLMSKPHYEYSYLDLIDLYRKTLITDGGFS